MNKDTLVSYIRDDEHAPHGVIVGKLAGDTVKIGISVCRVGLDKFNKAKGRMIAERRIAAGRNAAWRKEDLRDAIQPNIDYFKGRCERYFAREDLKFEIVGS